MIAIKLDFEGHMTSRDSIEHLFVANLLDYPGHSNESFFAHLKHVQSSHNLQHPPQ